jgi:hypothetical protein
VPFNLNFSNAEIQHQIWVATGGAMLVLLQSILSGTRRVWWRLLSSCVIGGGGAALAGHIFAESPWVYAICGVAAIVSENVIFGLFNASEEFKNAPIKVFADMWRLVMPTFGKAADKTSDAGSAPATSNAAG